MNKRYQVFVSSTFSDLKDERGKVIQQLMKMDCIPASMEFFTAVDDEVFEFIKTVIDDSDYYVLIIGGRYGSVDETGISYTEKEYDYAKEKGLVILTFIHGEPGKLEFEKSEGDPAARKKLKEFRNKVATGRIVEFWSDPSELAGLVTVALVNAIKLSPAIGWVRGSQIGSEELLIDLNSSRKEVERLKDKISNLSAKNSSYSIDNIANLDESIEIKFEEIRYSHSNSKNSFKFSWGQLFNCISPTIFKGKITDSRVNNLIN